MQYASPRRRRQRVSRLPLRNMAKTVARLRNKRLARRKRLARLPVGKETTAAPSAA